MGIARLIAKAWIVVCLYAGADALRLAVEGSADVVGVTVSLSACLLLFAAMGLLFVGGFGLSSSHAGLSRLGHIDPARLIPGFNETVFLIFMALSFVNLGFVAPAHIAGLIPDGLVRAIHFAVPGQRALEYAAVPCLIDGGRVFASGFTWFLALIYLCSGASRIRLTAGLIRLERDRSPEALGARAHAVAVGIVAIIGIQLLYVGSIYRFLPCSMLAGIPGALLIGLAPLMTAYAVNVALASLLALGKE
jgi:hypothetical protein